MGVQISRPLRHDATPPRSLGSFRRLRCGLCRQGAAEAVAEAWPVFLQLCEQWQTGPFSPVHKPDLLIQRPCQTGNHEAARGPRMLARLVFGSVAYSHCRQVLMPGGCIFIELHDSMKTMYLRTNPNLTLRSPKAWSNVSALPLTLRRWELTFFCVIYMIRCRKQVQRGNFGFRVVSGSKAQAWL